jgi:RHS repeat-associated protein
LTSPSAAPFDWAKRLATAALPSAWGAAAPATYTYRADGLAATRTWNGESDANALTFAYDAAKRPTGASKGTFLALGQGYDRRGNVTSEGRTFGGISGLAGTGTQSFTYDALSRLTGSSGLAGVARTYAYDLDGNRVSFTLGSDGYAVTFDRTDAATGTRKNGGAAVSFAWDRWGNLLTDAAAGTTAGIVAYGYDLADRTTSITRAGTTTTLALDALGRVRTRTTGSSTDTMTYEGASNEVVRVANAGGSGATTDGITDAAGTRLGTRRGSSVAWLVPDLHGSVAAGLALAATAISDALRYDGYGVTLAVHPAGGSGATAHWRYQGRLDLVPGSPDPAVPSLYDFGFREYAPALGAFTSLDDLVGSAQDPAALNRFLYAHANPATLIDPDGHVACSAMGADAADCHALSNGTGNSGGSDAVQQARGSSGTPTSTTTTSSTADSTPIKSGPKPGMGTGPAAGIDTVSEWSARASREWGFSEGNKWEAEVRARILRTIDATRYEVVVGRTIKDPSGRSVDLKKPDVQIIDRLTRRIVEIIDAKSSSTAEGLARMAREAVAKYTASSAKLPGGSVPVRVEGHRHRPYAPRSEIAARAVGVGFFLFTLIDIVVTGPPSVLPGPLPCYNQECVY